jgi:hypothetical protein
VRDALQGLVAEGVPRVGEPEPGEGFDEPLLRVELRLEGDREVEITVGKGDAWRDTSVFYLRRSDVAATFAVARARLEPLLNAF